MVDDVNTQPQPSTSRYADWKAPAGDGEFLIWPAPPRLLQDTLRNGKLLSSAHSVQLQNVPLPELRNRLRNWLGHRDDAGPLVATGHQTELYHPGVWVKNALIHLAAEKLGGQVFLNFGRYYKEDFTAVIDARALRLFAEAKLDPLALGEALVRVRGWIELKDGPRVTITHPEQIEVLATR